MPQARRARRSRGQGLMFHVVLFFCKDYGEDTAMNTVISVSSRIVKTVVFRRITSSDYMQQKSSLPSASIRKHPDEGGP